VKHGARLHWPLIIGLGTLALIYPVGRSTGLLQRIGEPVASLLVGGLISAVWLAAAVGTRLRKPALALSVVGIVAGLVRIALSTIPAPLLGPERTAGATSVVTLVGVLLAHALWGGALGMIALGLQALLRPRASVAAQEQEGNQE
jgi:hypothetical protein